MRRGDFDGLTAVVTGGASGIGEAVAAAFANSGASVAVVDLAIDRLIPGARGYRADITDRRSVVAAIEQIAADHGGIDIVVNSAGVSAIGNVEANDDAEWARVLDVNVTGSARVAAAALGHLRRSAHAAIVNVCSIAALNGLPDRALYSASKGAVLALTYAMATDHIREGVRVNCVSPGTVATAFVDRMLERFADPVAERAQLDARQATGRMVTPQEVADAVLYLAHPRSGSTTGLSLDVDGGVSHVRLRASSPGGRR